MKRITGMQAVERGLDCERQGQLEQAEAFFEQALALEPSNPDALHGLGLIALRQGRLQQAGPLLEKAVGSRPENPVFHHGLAEVLMQSGRFEEARDSCLRSIELDPKYSSAHNLLGALMHQSGRYEDAQTCFRRAIEADPGFVMGFSNLASTLGQLGRLAEAEACCRQALSMDPRAHSAHNTLGSVMQKLGRYSEAEAAFRRALETAPSNAMFRGNLASALLDQGRVEEAEHICLEAQSLQPEAVGPQWTLALIRLMRGDYQSGLLLYERRFDVMSQDRRERQLLGKLQPIERWHGGPLVGRRILVWTEQGFGDSLMVLRYLRLIKERGAGRLLVYCDPELLRLIQAIPAVDQAFSDSRSLKLDDFDLHCPLMSLPRAFGTRVETVPCDVPYVHVPRETKDAWRGRLASLPGIKVGIAWSGRKPLPKDARRHIAAGELASLAEVPGVSWINLQKEFSEGNAALRVNNWMLESKDFLDTAALIDACDLVVSVDTAVAHLAGALGKPVWLLNRFESDWRWMMVREDSPWYPTLRIFRQSRPGDWQEPIARVTAALRKLVEARR